MSPRIWATTMHIACVISMALTVACYPTNRPTPEQRVDRIVSDFIKTEGIPGVAVALLDGPKVVLEGAWGFADLEERVPMEVSSAMQIGSISKMMTAAAIVALAHEGRLSLDASAKDYLPKLPDQIGRATVRNLLNMTSGVPEFVRDPNYVAGNFDFAEPSEFGRDQLLRFIMKRPPDFEPGARWSYSSSNYTLLAAIIEAVTGEPYYAHLRRSVLASPEYKSLTPFDFASPRPPMEARGYSRNGNKLDRVDPVNPEMVVGDGGLLGNAVTLARWVRALCTGVVVHLDVEEEMRRPARLTDQTEWPYGAGINLLPSGGMERVGHSGGMPGYRAEVGYYPQRDLTIVVLTNHAGAPAHRIEVAVLRGWLQLPTPEFREVPISAQEGSQFLGLYNLIERWVRIEADEGGGLRLVVTDPGAQGAVRSTVPLMYLGEGVLAARADPEFVRIQFPSDPAASGGAMFDLDHLRWLGVRVGK